ncbi:hypothetical protein C3K47_12395 [Solitalea longa]|uniref:Uncharacterized protein n=1 Tax=Solitalea longa TaxID=2079460 RepID=A0A2S5A147_9SPHI|nr:DUF6526 family protein [Solitalea longa]POY35997.1 hypothetical protein C3K47_12395 [Solitalea longa]
MQSQNYSNHSQIVKGYHGLLLILLVAGFVGSIVNLVGSFNEHGNLYSASLILLLFICSLLIFYYLRTFALRAQDRAIRAEESLRHFALTGKLLDSRLRMGQIIALRFAPDEELVELTQKAINEHLSNKQIKQLIKNWKGDYHRV